MDKPLYPVGVSVLLTDHEGRILLGRRAKGISAGGMLSTPGGRIRSTEDRVMACCRKFWEETGAVLMRPVVELGYREHFRFDQHYFMLYFWARDYSGVIGNEEPDKCDGWEWYKPWEIPIKECTEPPQIIAEVGMKFWLTKDDCG